VHCSGIRALLPVEAVSVGVCVCVCVCVCDHCLLINALTRDSLHETSPYYERNLQLLESYALPGCCPVYVGLLWTFRDSIFVPF
jgi:hypothetical protein